MTLPRTAPERKSANHRPLAVVSNLFLQFCISERFCNTRCAGQRQRVQAGFVDDSRMLLSADGVTNRYPIPLTLIFRVYMVIQSFAGVAVPQRRCHVCPTPNSGRNKAKNRMNKRESNVNQTESKPEANHKRGETEREKEKEKEKENENEKESYTPPTPSLRGEQF